MRVKQEISDRWKIFWIAAGLVVMLSVYSFLCYKQKQKNPKDTTVPSLSQMVEGLKFTFQFRESNLKSLFDPSVKPEVHPPIIWVDFKATYGRLLKSLMLGVTIGICLGILMGSFAPIEYLFLWPLNLLSSVPPTALLGVFLTMGALLGWTEEFMFIALVVFGITPTFTRTIYQSARNDIHLEEVDKAYTLGASHDEIIWNVMIPRILPNIIDGIRLVVPPAMVYLMAIEYSLGSEGFGYEIRMMARKMSANVIYIYLFFLAISGLAINYGLLYLRRYLCPWYDNNRSD